MTLICKARAIKLRLNLFFIALYSFCKLSFANHNYMLA